MIWTLTWTVNPSETNQKFQCRPTNSTLLLFLSYTDVSWFNNWLRFNTNKISAQIIYFYILRNWMKSNKNSIQTHNFDGRSYERRKSYKLSWIMAKFSFIQSFLPCIQFIMNHKGFRNSLKMNFLIKNSSRILSCFGDFLYSCFYSTHHHFNVCCCVWHSFFLRFSFTNS